MRPARRSAFEIEGIGTLTNACHSPTAPRTTQPPDGRVPVTSIADPDHHRRDARAADRRDVCAVCAPTRSGAVPTIATGNLHVGNVRSALFNWAFARHHGGNLRAPIEDTDAGRNLEESYAGLLDSLRWLGWMGRWARCGRPVRSLHPVASAAASTATSSTGCWTPGWCTAASAPARRSRSRVPPGPRAPLGLRRVSAASCPSGWPSWTPSVRSSVVRMRVPDARSPSTTWSAVPVGSLRERCLTTCSSGPTASRSIPWSTPSTTP
jgi:hypothetical protein